VERKVQPSVDGSLPSYGLASAKAAEKPQSFFAAFAAFAFERDLSSRYFPQRSALRTAAQSRQSRAAEGRMGRGLNLTVDVFLE